MRNHCDYCSCENNWDTCCDNPENYVSSKYDYEKDEESGDENWVFSSLNTSQWEERAEISPVPSPHRYDCDWVKQEKNPILEEPLKSIPMRCPSLPILKHDKKSIEPLISSIKGCTSALKARNIALKARTSASVARNCAMRARMEAMIARAIALRIHNKN